MRRCWRRVLLAFGLVPGAALAESWESLYRSDLEEVFFLKSSAGPVEMPDGQTYRQATFRIDHLRRDMIAMTGISSVRVLLAADCKGRRVQALSMSGYDRDYDEHRDLDVDPTWRSVEGDVSSQRMLEKACR